MYCCEFLFEFFGFLFVGVVDFSFFHWDDILICIRWDDHISHITHARYGFSDFAENSSIRDTEREIESDEPEDDHRDQGTRCSHESIEESIDIEISDGRMCIPAEDRCRSYKKEHDTDES